MLRRGEGLGFGVWGSGHSAARGLHDCALPHHCKSGVHQSKEERERERDWEREGESKMLN